MFANSSKEDLPAFVVESIAYSNNVPSCDSTPASPAEGVAVHVVWTLVLFGVLCALNDRAYTGFPGSQSALKLKIMLNDNDKT